MFHVLDRLDNSLWLFYLSPFCFSKAFVVNGSFDCRFMECFVRGTFLFFVLWLLFTTV